MDFINGSLEFEFIYAKFLMVTIFRTLTFFLVAYIFVSALSVDLLPHHFSGKSSIDSLHLTIGNGLTNEIKAEKKLKKTQLDILWFWYSLESNIITRFSSVFIAYGSNDSVGVINVLGARAPPV